MKSLPKYKHFSFILLAMYLVISFVIAKDAMAQTSHYSYNGPFTNTTFNRSGRVDIDMTIHPDNSVSGYINFTNYPNVSRLCGAGDFTGSKVGNNVEFTFISHDNDPGCGFDWGLGFTIVATYSHNDSRIRGQYFINNGQRGVFRAETEWPDLSAIEKDYSSKINTNEAAFAHQFLCIATKSCDEYQSSGQSGWGGEFVRFLFDFMIDEDGLTDSLKVKCDPSDSNQECFEEAASEHGWELVKGFGSYCIANYLTGDSIDYDEWDTDHNQFLDTTVPACFSEVAAAGELPSSYASEKASSVRFLARFLREVIQVDCGVPDTVLSRNTKMSFLLPDLPPMPTRDELYLTSLESGSTLIVTTDEGFFLPVGTVAQLQIEPRTINAFGLSASSGPFEFQVINADNSIATVDQNGVLTIHSTDSPIVVVPHLIHVMVSNGSDWGIGQFAITDVDTDGDHIVNSYENKVGLDPNRLNRIQSDLDFDGIVDIHETLIGTLPTVRDSDADGYDDDIEVLFHSNPLDSSCNPKDGCKFLIYLPIMQR